MFGLPGNPVSSHVSFELFARPALRRMMGHADVAPAEVRRGRGAPRCRVGADGQLHLDRVRGDATRTAGTSRCAAARRRATCCRAMAAANGLALLPDGDGVAAGDELDVMLLD